MNPDHKVIDIRMPPDPETRILSGERETTRGDELRVQFNNIRFHATERELAVIERMDKGTFPGDHYSEEEKVFRRALHSLEVALIDALRSQNRVQFCLLVDESDQVNKGRNSAVKRINDVLERIIDTRIYPLAE